MLAPRALGSNGTTSNRPSKLVYIIRLPGRCTRLSSFAHGSGWGRTHVEESACLSPRRRLCARCRSARLADNTPPCFPRSRKADPHNGAADTQHCVHSPEPGCRRLSIKSLHEAFALALIAFVWAVCERGLREWPRSFQLDSWAGTALLPSTVTCSGQPCRLFRRVVPAAPTSTQHIARRQAALGNVIVKDIGSAGRVSFCLRTACARDTPGKNFFSVPEYFACLVTLPSYTAGPFGNRRC